MNQIFYQVFNVFCLENIKVISQKLGHCVVKTRFTLACLQGKFFISSVSDSSVSV